LRIRRCAPNCAASSFPADDAVNIYLNSESREFSDDLSLESLIKMLALEPTRVAIELNRSVVRRN
jgi:sulfur carrier protein ThiS